MILDNKYDVEMVNDKIWDFICSESIESEYKGDGLLYKSGGMLQDWDRRLDFICPVCGKSRYETFRSTYAKYGKDGAPSTIYKSFKAHLMATIRLNGDIDHINLLIDICGRGLGIKILRKMAEKNIVVANNLYEIIRKENDAKGRGVEK